MSESSPPIAPLTGVPARQAVDALAGYDYQIWRSVEAWFSLSSDEVLFLECAEDYDIRGHDRATANQVKSSPEDISLGHADVRKAIVNFWNLRQDNKTVQRLSYRFLTRGGIRIERPALVPGRKGIDMWQSAANGDDGDARRLADYLADRVTSADLKQFLSAASPEALREELFSRIEWVVGEPDLDQIRAIVRHLARRHGQAKGLPDELSHRALDRLLAHCREVALLRRPDLRALMRAALEAQFDGATSFPVPYATWLARFNQDRANGKAGAARLAHWFSRLWPILLPRAASSFWKIDQRNDLHQSVFAGLLTAELRLSENGPVCFFGKQRDAVLPALCLWIETASFTDLPGLILVDSKAEALQDTAVWDGVQRLGLAQLFDAFLHIDVRSENVPLAFSARARDWTAALLDALPPASRDRLHNSGFAHLLQATIESMPGQNGEAPDGQVWPNTVERALHSLCLPQTDLPGCLKDAHGKIESTSLRLDLESYLDRQCAQDVALLRNLGRELAARAIRLGPILQQATRRRPAVVLYDADDAASLVLAHIVHAMYHWRCEGGQLRDRNDDTSPVLYFSDRDERRLPPFIAYGTGSHTCIVDGSHELDDATWRAARAAHAFQVSVLETSFVYSGRRVRF